MDAQRVRAQLERILDSASFADAARAEVAHGFPQLLPDGRHFLYLAASSRPGESSIRAGSLDSTTSKVLLSADTSAAYAPALPGQPASLLFVYHGALMAQPFDARRLELSGDLSVVVPEIRYRRWFQAALSVSNNGVLLYQGGSAENQQFSWLDRQGKLLAAVGPPNDCISFNLSPDERYLAFYRDDDPATCNPTIWVMDLLREGAVFRFTDTGVAEAEFTPVWSPDGSEIMFSRGDDRGMRLLRQALNGDLRSALSTRKARSSRPTGRPTGVSLRTIRRCPITDTCIPGSCRSVPRAN